METAIAPATLMRLVNEAWRELWVTRVGHNIPLGDIKPNGQMIGLLFERLLQYKLHQYNPSHWPLERKKGDKDLHYKPDPSKSIEIKTSGQTGSAVYGNRSYALAPPTSECRKGAHYLVLNYTDKVLRKVRLGYLTHDHWQAQKTTSGQQSKLTPAGHACLKDLTQYQS